MGKLKRKRPLGIRKLRLEDNIKMDFKKWNGGMEWIDLTQERDRRRAVMNEVRNLRGS